MEAREKKTCPRCGGPLSDDREDGTGKKERESGPAEREVEVRQGGLDSRLVALLAGRVSVGESYFW